jgi:LmbE family N-acetylglucosaminyl deacetylase
MGEGLSARRLDDEDNNSSIRKRRALKSTVQKVVEKLGIKIWYYYQFEDNRFDHHDLLDLVKVIESAVKRHKPRVLYTHHPNDLNIDHRRTFEAVMTAVRPLKGQSVQTIYSVEVPSSSDWGGASAGSFHPNWFEDIGKTINGKQKLAASYPTEIREDPHPRSLEGLRQRSLQWGRLIGLEAAEAFVLQRHIQSHEKSAKPASAARK